MDPETIIAILSRTAGDSTVNEMVAVLYARWTVLSLREFGALTDGPRETAFAVVLERLARKSRRGRLEAKTLHHYATTLVLEALERQRRRESRFRGRFAECCGKWVPSDINGTRVTAQQLVEIVWRASLGDSSQEVAAVLHAVRNTWMHRRVFLELDQESREDAIQDAVEHLLRPVTAAALTTANVSRRLRDIPLAALSVEAKRRRRQLERVAEVDVDEIRRPSNPEEVLFRRFRRRLRQAMRDALYEIYPRLRPRKRPSEASLRQLRHRARAFFREAFAEVRRQGFGRTGLKPLRRRILRRRYDGAHKPRISLRAAENVANAVERILNSPIARALLPMPLLERVRAALGRRRAGELDPNANDSNAV